MNSSQVKKQLAAFFAEEPRVKQVYLFGSRATGKNRDYSDFDLVLSGEIDLALISDLNYALEEETNLPYFFDLINFDELENEELREHILEHGEVIYQS